MRADHIALYHRSLAKRRASSIEGFYAIERPRKRASFWRIAFAAAALLVVVTVWAAKS